MTCSRIVALPGTPVPSGQATAIYAKKGAPFTVGAMYWQTTWGGQQSCDLTTTVVPTGASYQVVFDVDTAAKVCRVGWAEGDGKSARPLPKAGFVSRKPRQPFFQTGGWCKDLGDAQRAALGVPPPPATN